MAAGGSFGGQRPSFMQIGEEANHLGGGVRPLLIRVRSAGIAAGPCLAGEGAGAGIGAAGGGAGGLLAGLGIMAIPGVGPVVAAGWLAATAAGAVAGAVAGGVAGGLIGALTDSGVSEEHAHLYAEGVRRGGTLVTAKVGERLHAEAEAILRDANWIDPDQRRAAYAEEGWTQTKAPYGTAEIEQERLRYRR